MSAALAEKLDITRFDEFKVQIRAILADIEDRLRDWWVHLTCGDGEDGRGEGGGRLGDGLSLPKGDGFSLPKAGLPCPPFQLLLWW